MALALSLFLDAGFLLNRLLDAQVEVAELYAAIQAALYLAATQLGGRGPRAPVRVAAWTAVAVLLVVAVVRVPTAPAVQSLLVATVPAVAVLWDLLLSEYRMGGTEASRHAAREGRLLLYLAYATWVAAQLVFSDTSTGRTDEVLALTPVLGLGYVIFGAPRVFLAFLAEGR